MNVTHIWETAHFFFFVVFSFARHNNHVQQRVLFVVDVVLDTRYVCRNKNRFRIVHKIGKVGRHSVFTWTHYRIGVGIFLSEFYYEYLCG